ncbi:hypothetical protein NE865_13017 [Phthorimaea operculella]|nr:hypothetical protein NE865_13017 [Phthorimaea operculella]
MVKIMRCMECCAVFLVLKCLPCESGIPVLQRLSGIFIIPEDVSTGSAAIYGFTPKVIFGNDHRAGFGFRFGNHADFQVMYEFGPQAYTRPLQPIRVRSAAYRQRVVKRRPFLELLIKAGLLDLKNESFDFDIETNTINEPR